MTRKDPAASPHPSPGPSPVAQAYIDYTEAYKRHLADIYPIEQGSLAVMEGLQSSDLTIRGLNECATCIRELTEAIPEDLRELDRIIKLFEKDNLGAALAKFERFDQKSELIRERLGGAMSDFLPTVDELCNQPNPPRFLTEALEKLAQFADQYDTAYQWLEEAEDRLVESLPDEAVFNAQAAMYGSPSAHRWVERLQSPEPPPDHSIAPDALGAEQAAERYQTTRQRIAQTLCGAVIEFKANPGSLSPNTGALMGYLLEHLYPIARVDLPEGKPTESRAAALRAGGNGDDDIIGVFRGQVTLGLSDTATLNQYAVPILHHLDHKIRDHKTGKEKLPDEEYSALVRFSSILSTGLADQLEAFTQLEQAFASIEQRRRDR